MTYVRLGKIGKIGCIRTMIYDTHYLMPLYLNMKNLKKIIHS